MAALLSLLIAASIFLLLNTFSSSSSYGVVNGLNFTYSGSTGPNMWGRLDPKFWSCSNGKSQSPVDILRQNVVVTKILKPLDREYTPANATLVNNLVNVGLRYGENAGEMISDGKVYKLKQMHWHTPSEHTINGVQYPAELHLVHLADDGNYSVVGLLYRLGKADPLIAKIQDKLHKLAVHVSGYSEQLTQIPVGTFKLKELQKNTRSYFRYRGSFTTPPCTEIVNWHILGKVRSMSMEQLEALRAPLVSSCKHNARPVQPLYGRQIQLFEAQQNKH